MNGFSGAVLAGGDSSRLGVDKRFLRFRGRTLLDLMSNLLEKCVDEILVSCGPDENLLLSGPHYILVRDSLRGQGPLHGIIRCLEEASNPWLAVVPCDLPLLRAEHLLELIDVVSPGRLAIVGFALGEPQPLVSVYHKEILPLAEAYFSSGGRSVKGFLQTVPEGRIRLCHLPDEIFDMNINTPEDYGRFMGS